MTTNHCYLFTYTHFHFLKLTEYLEFRYEPSSGYTWNFEAKDNDDDEDGDVSNLGMRRKRIRRILDNRPPGQRTEEEEEGIRASEAIDGILLRISKSTLLVGNKPDK